MLQNANDQSTQIPKLPKIKIELCVEPNSNSIKQFICPICHFIVTDPTFNCANQKLYCNPCILESIKNGTEQGTISQISIAPGAIINFINNLKIYCLNKTKNCDWSGKYADLPRHLMEECKKEIISCPFSLNGCTQKLPREEINDHHKDDCEYRNIECRNNCGYENLIYKNEEEHLCICPNEKIKCPQGCEVEILRKNIQEHFDRDCPLTLFPCLYSPFGCKTLILKSERENHLKECFDEHNHLLIKDIQAFNTNYTMRINKFNEERSDINYVYHKINQMLEFIQNSEYFKLETKKWDDLCNRDNFNSLEETLIGLKTNRKLEEESKSSEDLKLLDNEIRDLEKEKMERENLFKELIDAIPDL